MVLNTGIPKTPLYAAFFCAAIMSACSVDHPGQAQEVSQCPAPSTSIATVQGKAKESPILGQQVTVQGIVTLVQNGHGLYIEETGSDSDERTSNAVFVQTGSAATGVEIGSLISASGKVSEIGKGRYLLTAITEVDGLSTCATDQPLPLTDIALPLKGPGREALEGMRVRIDDSLVVTDVYQFNRGNITLSGNGLQTVPTEVVKPGQNAADLLADNRAFALPVELPENLDLPAMLVSGMAVNDVIGVVAHDGRGLRVSLQSISVKPVTDLTPPAAPATGVFRIVGMNLHNYFNGDGNGRGFPTPRGAETLDEFIKQRDRIGAAIKILSPHMLAVMELENDGFGPESAAKDFIQLANEASQKPWAVTRPGGDDIGNDKISVAIFYRSDLLKALGPARTLTGPEFKRSRQPLAQIFQPIPDGEKFVVVINHLKSKGSCPDTGENADQKDGQGCWNPIRLASAEKMSAWAGEIATSAGTENILILGDMNAYRNEDPIAAIRDAGFTELMDKNAGQVYSFVFYGQHGSLDYAFASPALLDNVQQAFIWNVNAAFPANMDFPQPWLRFSDHDPVVVDIRVRHSSTSD